MAGVFAGIYVFLAKIRAADIKVRSISIFNSLRPIFLLTFLGVMQPELLHLEVDQAGTENQFEEKLAGLLSV